MVRKKNKRYSSSFEDVDFDFGREGEKTRHARHLEQRKRKKELEEYLDNVGYEFEEYEP